MTQMQMNFPERTNEFRMNLKIIDIIEYTPVTLFHQVHNCKGHCQKSDYKIIICRGKDPIIKV